MPRCSSYWKGSLRVALDYRHYHIWNKIYRWIIIIIINHQRIGTGTGGLGNKRMSRDYPNNSIVEIDQNTKKRPGDLRDFFFHSNSSEKTSVNAGVKNSQMSRKIMIIIKPEFVLENESILWDFEKQPDHSIQIRRSDLVLINKKEKKNLSSSGFCGSPRPQS